jgi:hypothetical protein
MKIKLEACFGASELSKRYHLPNVKPVRIRMSSSMAQSMLTHQVNLAIPS